MIAPEQQSRKPPQNRPSPHIPRNPFDESGSLGRDVFLQFAEEYRSRVGLSLVCTDAQGNLLYGLPSCEAFPCRQNCRECRKQALHQCLRRGTPAACQCASGFQLWGVPVMANQEVRGGLLVVGPDSPTPQTPASGSIARQVLLRLAVEYNLTNEGFLNRAAESANALAVPASQRETHDLTPVVNLEQIAHRLEDAETELLRAVVRREADEARDAVDAVTGLLRRLDSDQPGKLLGGYLLRLSGLLFQAARDAGGNRAILLEEQLESASRILRTDSADAVSREMRTCLEAIFEHLADPVAVRTDDALSRALSFIEARFPENLSRARVARAAGISEGHLSHLLRDKTGFSFTELLNRYRVDRAAQLLLRTDKPLIAITLEVGFSDQSYFGRVFRRYYGTSPSRFREGPINKTVST